MKIAIVNQKGGVGKSTLAANMSLVLASQGHSVALVDADIQRSSSDTLKERDDVENLHVFVEQQEKIGDLIDSLNEDYVIVDCPGWQKENVLIAAMSSEVVIIPVQPSAFDMKSTDATVYTLNAVKKRYADLKCNMLIARAVKGRLLSGSIRKELQERYPAYHVLDNVMYEREAYKQSMFFSQSVVEYNGGKSPAAKELLAIVDEIISL